MCTRVLWNTNQIAVLTGRSMDWPESTQPLVVSFPRGRQRDGGLLLTEVVVPDNPLRWTSTLRQPGDDGLRPRLGRRPQRTRLRGARAVSAVDRCGARDGDAPGLHTGLWRQYLLDQAATVEKALALMKKSSWSWSLRTDSTPRCTSRWRTTAATRRSSNYAGRPGDPPRSRVHADDQRSHLRRATRCCVEGLLAPEQRHAAAGNVNAVDRFQRAAYYSALLPDPPTNDRQWPALAICATSRCRLARPTGIRGLQHRVPHGVRPHQPDVLLRAHHQPEPDLGRMDGLDLGDGAKPRGVDPYDVAGGRRHRKFRAKQHRILTATGIPHCVFRLLTVGHAASTTGDSHEIAQDSRRGRPCRCRVGVGAHRLGSDTKAEASVLVRP